MNDDQAHRPAETTAASTPSPAKRFANALLIVNPGAINPSGIALSIADACREAREEGVSTRDDPAVRLMVTQLAWICRADSDTEDYGQLMEACRQRVGEGA